MYVCRVYSVLSFAVMMTSLGWCYGETTTYIYKILALPAPLCWTLLVVNCIGEFEILNVIRYSLFPPVTAEAILKLVMQVNILLIRKIND